MFVDTSACLALVVATDAAHRHARKAFEALRLERATLITTSYVLVETYALMGRRLGLETTSAFAIDFAPVLDIVWVDAGLHERALRSWFKRDRRRLSLVDVLSFLVIAERKIDAAFAFDRHFAQEGIPLVTDSD